MQELMKGNYVAFQCYRDNTVHFSHFLCFLCKWEACCFTNMILTCILCHWKYIINTHTGGDLWEDRFYQICTGSKVCLFCFFKGQ